MPTRDKIPYFKWMTMLQGLSQQFLNQLTTILQQVQSATSTGVAHGRPDATGDDHLSAASLPVQSNPLPAG